MSRIKPYLSKLNLSEEIGNEIVKKAKKYLEDLIENQTYDAQIGEQSPKPYYSKFFNRDHFFDLAVFLISYRNALIAREKQEPAQIFIAIQTKLTNFILQEAEKYMEQQPLPQLLKEENEYTLKKEDKSALEKMCPDYLNCNFINCRQLLKSNFYKAVKKISDKLTNQEIEQLFTDLDFSKPVMKQYKLEFPQNNSQMCYDIVMKQYELGTEVPQNNSQIVTTNIGNLTINSQKIDTENLSNVSIVTDEQIISSLVKLAYSSKLTKEEITDFIADLGVDIAKLLTNAIYSQNPVKTLNELLVNRYKIIKLTFLTALDKIYDKLTKMQIDQLFFDLGFESHKNQRVLHKKEAEVQENHPKILIDSKEKDEQLNQIKKKLELLQINFRELQKLLSELK